jgi:hypothetical protein
MMAEAIIRLCILAGNLAGIEIETNLEAETSTP